MSWELRHGKPVYYRAYRLHGHIKKIYLGSGSQAERAAAEDAERREKHQRERTERQHIATLNEETQTLYNHVRILTRAAYIIAGYHQHHRGEWRKRRQQIITCEGDIMVPQIQVQEKLSTDDLESLILHALTGDENTLPAIKNLLDNAPVIWQDTFNITKKVETAWIQTIAGQDLLTRETLVRQVDYLKRTLQAEFSSPLESLVIGTIATCFLAWKQSELAAADQLKRYGNALTQTQQNHLTACQRRFLTAIKELARIRQLLKPCMTTVLNIANQQQVNLT